LDHWARQTGGWEKVDDKSVLDRPAPVVQGKVYVTNLKAQGVCDFGRVRSRGFSRPKSPAALELFFDYQPITLARWPNNRFLKIISYPEAMTDDHGGTLGKLTRGFNYESDRPEHWRDTNDIWVHGEPSD